jgi:hypothetical protein
MNALAQFPSTHQAIILAPPKTYICTSVTILQEKDISKMSGKLSYKEYKSLGEGVTGRFPQAEEPVNPAVVSSRRPHIKAFLTYMAPDVVDQHDKWWEEAAEFVAASYDEQGFKAVPTEIFDFRVDREAFEIFCEYYFDSGYD